MQAASRESLIALRERLDAVTAEAGAEVRLRLAADLRDVAVLLGREPALRRALADAAQASARRVSLLENLLGAKLSAEALEVLRTAVGARWSSPGELVDGIEILAIDAELFSAEADGVLADVEDELFRFSRIVSGDRTLAGAFSDSTADRARLVELVGDLVGDRARPVTVRLAEMAVHGIGGRGFDASLQWIVERAATRRDNQVAYVRAAAPLTEQQEERLTGRLAAMYGRSISLKVEVDPAVIGGATVRVGDDLYDGSVARRLEQARSALAT